MITELSVYIANLDILIKLKISIRYCALNPTVPSYRISYTNLTY